jgi:hypothetical protein
MAKKAVWILLFVFLMTTPAYAGESVTFENYLQSFDYQERRNMKIGIQEMLHLGLLGLADYLRGDRAKDFINDMKQ